MINMRKLLLAGAAVPLVLVAFTPSKAVSQSSPALLAQAEILEEEAEAESENGEGGLRERIRRRGEERGARREERRGADQEEDEDEDEAERQRERAAEEEAERERQRAAEEEAERVRQQERAAEEEADRERQRAAEEEAERVRQQERAAEEEADRERQRAAEEEAERVRQQERAAEEEADRERQRAAEEETERRRQQQRADEPSSPRAATAEDPAQDAEEGESAEEPALRERLRERRQRDRAADDATERDPAPAQAEEQVEEQTRETVEEPAERPSIGERFRRALTGEDAPAAEEPRPDAEAPATVEEPVLRDRLRERRRGERAERRRDRPRDASEAQQSLDEIATEREEIREDVRALQRQRETELEALERDVRQRGNGDVVQRSGDRVIIRSENNYFIQNNDMRRFVRRAEDVETRRRDRGYSETVIRRHDGTQVVTLLDEYGDIVMRMRVLPDGREIVLIDNRQRDTRWRDERHRVDYYSEVLPPLVIDIPREHYIVETGRASRQDIHRALTAPTVEVVEEVYSLDEVLYNERIRDMVPRVDLDSITFEFNSAEVPDDQIDTLEEIGVALEDIIAENPSEVFLVEGHTDWPGSHEINLALSDRRAENVAIILTEYFDIPPENLVTQGYGKQYLKIQTQAPERRNRRVTVRRITELMAGG